MDSSLLADSDTHKLGTYISVKNKFMKLKNYTVKLGMLT